LFVNPTTGAITGSPVRTGEYAAVLVAVDAAAPAVGMGLPRELDQLVLKRWPFNVTGTPGFAIESYSRSKLGPEYVTENKVGQVVCTVGTATLIAPINLSTLVAHHVAGNDNGEIRFTITNQPPGFFIDPATGEIQGNPRAASVAGGAVLSRLVAVDPAGSTHELERIEFSFKAQPRFEPVFAATRRRGAGEGYVVPGSDGSPRLQGGDGDGTDGGTYYVGTTYLIASFALERSRTTVSGGLVDDVIYTLSAEAPSTVFVQATTGTVSGAFDAAGRYEFAVLVVDKAGTLAVVEQLVFDVKMRPVFSLELGPQSVADRYYPVEGGSHATRIAVFESFQLAPPNIFEAGTILSDGSFADIKFTLKVQGLDEDDQPIQRESPNFISVKLDGAVLGRFEPTDRGRYDVVVTAVDGGGQSVEATRVRLEVLFADVDNADFGPNGRACQNAGEAVDGPGDERFDTNFTCRCTTLFTGDNCETAVKLSVATLPYRTKEGGAFVDYDSDSTRYFAGSPYRIAPLALDYDRTVTAEGSPRNITYTLEGDSTDGWFVSAATGEVFGQFSEADVSDGSQLTRFSLVAVDEGGKRDLVEAYAFRVLPPVACEPAQTLITWTDRDPYCMTFEALSFGRAADFAPPLDGIYAVGQVYVFPELDVSALELSFEGPDGKAGLSFTLANPPGGAMIEPSSGLVRLIAEEPFIGTMSLDVIDSSGARATVERTPLDVRYADDHGCSGGDVQNTSSCMFAENGPGGRACAHGATEDAVKFDSNFTCNCANTIFVGANCEVLCEHGVAEGGTACNAGLSGGAASKGALTSAEGGGLFGAIVALFLVAVAAVQYRAYRERHRPVDFDSQLDRMVESGELLEDQLNPTLRPREIKRQNVVLLEQVGKGAFGAVWKALLDESKSANGVPEYMVAAKTVLDKDANSDATDDLLNEAAVMAQVAGADGHPNLVSLIGVVTKGNPLILLLSYAEHGSVLGVLSTRAAAGEPLAARSKVEMAAQTARGMAHLSEKRFIHRDLAARNVLLASGRSASHMVAKVADFGLSRGSSKQTGGAEQENTEDYYRSQRGVFPVRWTAPESMETLVFTYASDVWSFGIVLVEIFGDGEKPYHSMRSNADVMAYTMSGNIHPKPDGCSDTVYTLMARCWALDPSQRPPFAALAAKLERIAAELSNSAAEHATDAAGPGGYEGSRPTDGPASKAKRRSTAEGYQLPVGTANRLPRAVENTMYLEGDAFVDIAEGQESMYDTLDVDDLPMGDIRVARTESNFYANSLGAPLDRASQSRAPRPSVAFDASGPAALYAFASATDEENATASTSSGPAALYAFASATDEEDATASTSSGPNPIGAQPSVEYELLDDLVDVLLSDQRAASSANGGQGGGPGGKLAGGARVARSPSNMDATSGDGSTRPARRASLV
jgi:serine/threonine protein kinase